LSGTPPRDLDLDLDRAPDLDLDLDRAPDRDRDRDRRGMNPRPTSGP